MAVCHYHPDRPGIGVCMRCRVVVCADCSTRVDGVNHCHACLQKLGRHDSPRGRSGLPGAAVAVVTLAGAGTLFFLLAWMLQGRFAP